MHAHFITKSTWQLKSNKTREYLLWMSYNISWELLWKYKELDPIVLKIKYSSSWIEIIFRTFSKKFIETKKSYKFNDFEKHLDICCTKMQTSIINLTQKFRKKVRNAYVVYEIPKNKKQVFHNIWITNNITKLESNIISNNKSFISKKSQTFFWIESSITFTETDPFKFPITSTSKEIQIFKQIQIWNKSSNQFEVIIFIF